MFAHLKLSRAPCYSPEDFWAAFKDYDGEPVNVREHEDSYEFFTRLQVGHVAKFVIQPVSKSCKQEASLKH